MGEYTLKQVSIETVLNAAHDFQVETSIDEFRVIWGDAVGERLWAIYKAKYTGNILDLYVQHLTYKQKETFVEFIIETFGI